jgi:hypothetical protein
MKYSAFNMTPKSNDKFCNANIRHPHRISKSQMTKMLVAFFSFFSIKGTAHFESITQGQTVNQAYYVEILTWFVERDLNFSPTIGFSTMTMLQLTRRSLSSSFWPKNPLLKRNTHPIPLSCL